MKEGRSVLTDVLLSQCVQLKFPPGSVTVILICKQ